MKRLEEEEILNSKIPIMDPAKKVMQEQMRLQIDNNFMSFLENMKSRMRMKLDDKAFAKVLNECFDEKSK